MDTYQKLGAPKCEKVGKRLSAYGKTPITTLGKIEVGATYKQKKARLEVIVVDRYDVTNILGLDSFGKLGFGVVDELNVIAEQEIHILEELEREFPKCLRTAWRMFNFPSPLRFERRLQTSVLQGEASSVGAQGQGRNRIEEMGGRRSHFEGVHQPMGHAAGVVKKTEWCGAVVRGLQVHSQ